MNILETFVPTDSFVFSNRNGQIVNKTLEGCEERKRLCSSIPHCKMGPLTTDWAVWSRTQPLELNVYHAWRLCFSRSLMQMSHLSSYSRRWKKIFIFKSLRLLANLRWATSVMPSPKYGSKPELEQNSSMCSSPNQLALCSCGCFWNPRGSKHTYTAKDKWHIMQG